MKVRFQIPPDFICPMMKWMKWVKNKMSTKISLCTVQAISLLMSFMCSNYGTDFLLLLSWLLLEGIMASWWKNLVESD